VGFLLAGFALRMVGLEPDSSIESLAHAGVLALLFSVGLKLRLKSLASADVLCGAVLHLLVFGVVLCAVLIVGTAMPPYVALIVALSLGLSSTVVAAKVLEEKRELRAFHGRIAIGILIVQDLVAVSLLSAVTGVAPSWWALVLVVGLVFGAPVFHRLLKWSGHGELVVVFGLTVTLAVGGAAFTTVGLSPELGALLTGAVIASHPAANELS
jgi:predicted Kef-type K+ transport protein